MSKIEQSIAKQALRSGRPVPDRIANAPELKPGLLLYMQAFFDLDSERSHAFGPTPIPWTSIYQYAKAFELDPEQTEDMFYFIKAMDSANLKRIEEKSKQK